MRYAAIALLLLFAFSSCSEKEDPEPEIDPEEYSKAELLYPAPKNGSFQKIAYFPDYRNFDPVSIPDETLKMLDVACFAFATIQPDNTAKIGDSGQLMVLVNRCHKLGVKVLLSLSGDSELFRKMTGLKSTRAIFEKSVMDIVSRYNLDGVDNDWEYPSSASTSAVGNLNLMREFSNLLHADGSEKLLTMAITPGKYEGSYSDGILNDVFDCVDWFNVMVYDDFSTKVAGINHSPFSLMEIAYEYWVNKRRLPKEKFVGGLPCYGRPSGMTQSGTVKTYSSILDQGGDPDADEAVVSSTNYPSYTIYYNGRPTIRKKVAYCLEKGVGGYFFWEAGQDKCDDRSLIKAAYEEVCALVNPGD